MQDNAGTCSGFLVIWRSLISVISSMGITPVESASCVMVLDGSGTSRLSTALLCGSIVQNGLCLRSVRQQAWFNEHKIALVEEIHADESS